MPQTTIRVELPKTKLNRPSFLRALWAGLIFYFLLPVRAAFGSTITQPLGHTFGATFNDAGGLTANQTAYATIPFRGTIKAWNITVDQGTCSFDIWVIPTGTAIPTIANTIVAAAPPTIASGTARHSTTLTGWTTNIAKDSIFGINLSAVGGGVTYANLTVEMS